MAIYYENEAIHMRALMETDAEDIFAFASNPNVKRYIGWPLMKTLEETQTFLDMLMKRHAEKTHFYGAVVEKASDKVIGVGMIFGFDDEANHAELGYVFCESVWGKGYGSVSTAWLMDYAFGPLGRRKLFARVVSSNEGSVRVLTKNGFEREGILKDMYRIDGELKDCLYYGRLSPKCQIEEGACG